MTIAKTVFAMLAAFGLAAAPVAVQAAAPRTSSPVTRSEQAAGTPTLAWVLLAGFAATLVVVLATSDNGNGVPVSP